MAILWLLFAALRTLTTCPMKMISQLQAMLKLAAPDLLQFTDSIVSSLPIMLDEVVPRKIVDLVKKVWFLLHSVSPRRWANTRLVSIYALVTCFVYVCSFVNFHIIIAIQCNHFSTVTWYVSFIQDNECMFTKPKPFIYLKHYHRKMISLELPSHAKILLFC